MPGTPVLYYGDEIGMGDNIFLGDRDGVRTPMQWTSDRNGGFSRADPQRLYLPPIQDPIYGYEAVNVEAQARESTSLMNWTKRLLALRGGTRAFGLRVISGDPLLAGDVRLVTAQGEAANSSTLETTLPDGGFVYFVGLIAPSPLAQVNVRYGAGSTGAAFFNVDDVTLVPAPAAGAGAGTAAGALAALRLRFRHRKETP